MKVLYNGSCPICSKEIDHYRKHSTNIEYEDLETIMCFSAWGIDKEDAKKSLHVYHDETVYTGVNAFIVLWREIPRYKWLSTLVSYPMIYPIANIIYDNLLAPILYRINRKNIP